MLEDALQPHMRCAAASTREGAGGLRVPHTYPRAVRCDLEADSLIPCPVQGATLSVACATAAGVAAAAPPVPCPVINARIPPSLPPSLHISAKQQLARCSICKRGKCRARRLPHARREKSHMGA